MPITQLIIALPPATESQINSDKHYTNVQQHIVSNFYCLQSFCIPNTSENCLLAIAYKYLSGEANYKIEMQLDMSAQLTRCTLLRIYVLEILNAYMPKILASQVLFLFCYF